jgi:hypothetical protein
MTIRRAHPSTFPRAREIVSALLRLGFAPLLMKGTATDN